MIAKEQYKALCETEGSKIPLFLHYWWMETVCRGKCWDVLMVNDKQGRVVAALPYLIGSKMGLRYILQPQLTQYSGPWYPTCSLEEEMEAGRQLVAGLKGLGLVYYQQNYSPLVTNWLPYYWAGYRQTTRYTYRIDDISDPQRVFEGFDPSRRQRQIRRTEGVLHPVAVTPERFVEFHAAYWVGRGEKDLLSKSFMLSVIRASLERGQGLLMGLEDVDGRLQGARFVVYDDKCAYSLLSAMGEGHPNGTSARLFFEIIKRLSGTTQAFDFEGSMDRGVEQSYRLYGARQVPYFRITKVL